jgi:hypothetical protein
MYDRRTATNWAAWTFGLLLCLILFGAVFIRGMAALLVTRLVAIVTWPIQQVADQLAQLHADSEAIKAAHGVGPAFGVLAAIVFCAIVVIIAVARAHTKTGDRS